MLSKAKTLNGYQLHSLDGEIGTVKDFYFDDRHWTIRYLVADTGNWLTGKVLLSPYALNNVVESDQQICVNLTKQQIENSPQLDRDKPISRQFEDDYYGYYGWPTYWTGDSVWGIYARLERDRSKWAAGSTASAKAWDRHLRSTHEVTGYHLQSLDGEIGHIEDFVIDDKTWTIRYLIVGTKNWWPGKTVLISPQWIERVSWSESKVFVNLSREAIQRSPEYTQESLLTRDYEVGLHSHYSRKGYWYDELAAV